MVFLIVSLETNSSVFSFSLISSVSVRLVEKVSCTSLVGVSLCRCVSMQSVCPQALGQSWS